ncbi:MAG: tripartite tricarboxylate transporter TctB family protein [Desulfuromonadales bacterium]|nr:tripartite tricarboxylate transporter TctB family protein [Desulfuromonadales bacterium]MBN2792035.1 tripartite tricarboxylate transporter TctB family protein [Desulfuromonadales bacterium]
MDAIKKYVVQAGLVGISLLVYLSSAELSASARAFPRAMALGLLVLVVLLIVTNAIKQAKGDSEKVENPGSSLNVKTMSILVGFIVFNVLFVWLMPKIGFEVAGFLFIFGGMIMLGGKAAARYWWVALGLPILLGVVFRTLLDLRLPLPPFMS